MALLRNKGLHYQVGFALYFIAFFVLLCSLALPGTWVYDREEQNEDPSRPVKGHSVWDLIFSTCLSAHNHNTSRWRCEPLGRTHAAEQKKWAVALLAAGTVCQLGACVAVTVYNCYGRPLTGLGHFPSEILAMLAAVLSYTGVLMYMRYTYYALNIQYGPGIFLHLAGVALAYAALLLTAVHQPPHRRAPTPPS
ncbi:uncharacterized protein LOC143288904 [Babylonia areolata]|uniref:uncharacterized protein LOC143288904 n=1 Tax=Babylonia areolata TaxID=304850 RepID=UPI003FD4DE52